MIKQISQAEVSVGDRIGVIGQPGEDEELEAKVVWIIPEGQFNHN